MSQHLPGLPAGHSGRQPGAARSQVAGQPGREDAADDGHAKRDAELARWLTVEPSQLAAAGELIADHPEVPFASAITGTADIVAAVVCRDTGSLYRYVTTRIGAIAGVRQLEISPMLRRVKRAGTLVDGQRLAVLPPP
jgi:DNA-binding Lrp family transcriptional regulator